MSVKIQFKGDSEIIEEVDARGFGYHVDKLGNMTVVLVGENPEVMISVHTGVRSAWNTADPTKAIDISSMPKKP